MKNRWISRLARHVAALCLCAMAVPAMAQPVFFDAALRERIDAFVESVRKASGISGIALTIVQPDGIAPLLAASRANIEGLACGLSGVSLKPPWRGLMQQRVLQPLSMTHSHVDHAAARRDGLTAVSRIVFGVPIQRQTPWLPAFEPTGGLRASASDMARYPQRLLAGGQASEPSSSRVVSAARVAQLLAPASPSARSTLLSADFDFRHVEGRFVGPFGAAADARCHLGSLTTFAAVALVIAVPAARLGPSWLWAFAPELALVLAAVPLPLCLPLVRRLMLRRRT